MLALEQRRASLSTPHRAEQTSRQRAASLSAHENRLQLSGEQPSELGLVHGTRMGIGIASMLAVTLAVVAGLLGCELEAPLVPNETPVVNAGLVTEASDSDLLNRVLDQQSDSVKTRYAFRHPAETLSFFGIKPGMTVVETDPGGGWYSRILHSYLGKSGRLIGADFSVDMYPLFDYYSAEELAAQSTWSERWPSEVMTLGEGARVEAFYLGSMPEAWIGEVDAFLFVRSLHNLEAFEDEGGYRTRALSEAFRALKPGGIVGVVQHMGPESHSDEWASGNNGYLKRSAVIASMETAGFVLDGESDINLNPADVPSESEYVWRLPPTSEVIGDTELAEAYAEIGESNRMTLRFRKPGVNE